MTIYRKALLGSTKDEILRYISSIEEDREFVEEVVEVLKAHVRELMRRKYVRPDVGEEIIEVLNEVLKDPSKVLSSEFEDVHEGIEAYLMSRLGDKAGYLALGRSRNDHVATALRLKIIKEINNILDLIKDIRKTLLNLAMKYVEVPMPLFTHEQPAQIGSVAQYLLYIDDVFRTHAKLLSNLLNEVVGKSPLGCGAIVGTNACLDRESLANELGFNTIIDNCIYATTSRDFIFLTTSVLTSLALELSRIFNDLISWISPYMSIVEIGEEHLATSSLMPHKKNPVTLEVMRAWAGELVGELVTIASIIKGIHSGYSLDLQEINKHCFNVINSSKNTLKVLKDLITNALSFDLSKLMSSVSSYELLTTDVAELIALEVGIPYRLVHSLIAKCIRGSSSVSDFNKCLLNEINKYLREGDKANKIKELSKKLRELLKNPESVIQFRCVIGSSNPELLLRTIKSRLGELSSS